MKERMQKTLSQVNGCPQRDRSETEWYGGVQTFMWMCEDNIVEVPFDKEHLFEQILSPANLNRAYKAVMRNKGCGGIDKMSCEQLLPWLLTNKDELIRSLMDGSYRPNPVKRVEIPKDNGKMRLLGIPTVVDRLVQQAINQVLTPIYENQFSNTSYGFRPRRGCHDAIRGAQRIINEGYKYHLANMKRLLLETDEWLRRRIRMCIWKAWKKVKTKVANLIRCGINKYQAYEWGNTRKGYWRIADSPVLKRAIDNNKLRSAGYATLMGAYLEWHPK